MEVRGLLSDSGVYLLGRAVPAAISIALVALLVRQLGEAEYGVYAIVTSGTNLISVFVIGWLSQAVLRFRMDPSVGPAIPQILRSGLWIATGFGLALCLIVFAALPVASSAAITVLGALILLVGLNVHAAYTAQLQAELRARSIAFIEIARALIVIPLCLIFAAVVSPSSGGAVIGLSASFIVSGILAYRMSQGTRGANLPTGEYIARARQAFSFGWPMSLWLAVSLSFPFGERVLMERFLGTAAIGQYAAVYDLIFRGAGFALLPVVLAAHPRLMREYSRGNYNAAQRLWIGALGIQLVIGIGIVGSVALLAGPIRTLVGLPASNDFRALVVALAMAGCVWQAALLCHKPLEARVTPGIMLMALAVSFVTCMVADVLLLRRFGALAAAYSLLGSGVLYCGVVVLFGRTMRGHKAPGGIVEG